MSGVGGAPSSPAQIAHSLLGKPVPHTRPTLQQLMYFLAVAEHASFRRAAEHLGISQPTLTGHISAMEKRLNIQLFERSRAGTHISPAGRKLLEPARQIVEEVDTLAALADQARSGARGVYRLGVSPTLGPYLLPHLLPALHQRYGELRLHVREDIPARLEHDLAQGQYDLILTTLPLNNSQLRSTPLLRESIALVLPMDHPLSRQHSIRGVDLAGLQILTIEDRHQYSRHIQQLCARLGAEVLQDYQGTSLDSVRVMVVMGLGAAFLPALYISSEIGERADTLRITRLADEELSRTHVLVWRPSSPARGFFLQLAKDIRALIADMQVPGVHTLSD